MKDGHPKQPKSYKKRTIALIFVVFFVLTRQTGLIWSNVLKIIN